MTSFPLLQILVDVTVDDRLDGKGTRAGEGDNLAVLRVADDDVLAVRRYLALELRDLEQQLAIPPYAAMVAVPATAIPPYIVKVTFKSSIAFTGVMRPVR